MEFSSPEEKQLHAEQCDQLYFKDCIRSGGMYEESIHALVFYTQTQLGIDESTAAKIVIDAEVIRPVGTRQETFDQAIAAPIVLLGDYIEGLCSAEEAGRWYDTVVRDTLAVAMKATHHDAGCIDRTVLMTNDLTCQSGSESDCPVKVVRHSLLQSADARHFHDSPDAAVEDNKYLFDPEKTHDITLHKLELAWMMNFITKSQEAVLRGMYERRYDSQLK
jgi:hypothetical protein